MDNMKDGLERFPEFGKGIVKRTNELPDSEAKGLFLGWFNNRMGMILLAIQNIKAKDTKSMANIEFFLHDLEHHFVAGSNKSVFNAFRYLRHFFKIYPNVKLAHCKKALVRLGQIYGALGLELDTSGFNPKLSGQERIKRKISGYLKEVMKPVDKQREGIGNSKIKILRQQRAASEIVFRQRIRAGVFYLLHVLDEYPKLPQNEKQDVAPFAIETSYLLGRLLDDGNAGSTWMESFRASQSIQRYFQEGKEIDKASADKCLQNILSQLNLDSDSEELQPSIQPKSGKSVS